GSPPHRSSSRTRGSSVLGDRFQKLAAIFILKHRRQAGQDWIPAFARMSGKDEKRRPGKEAPFSYLRAASLYIARATRGPTLAMTSRASKALGSLAGLAPRPMTISAEAS